MSRRIRSSNKVWYLCQSRFERDTFFFFFNLIILISVLTFVSQYFASFLWVYTSLIAVSIAGNVWHWMAMYDKYNRAKYLARFSKCSYKKLYGLSNREFTQLSALIEDSPLLSLRDLPQMEINQ